jgi:tetratricopeptide (TPR) repeat protein
MGKIAALGFFVSSAIAALSLRSNPPPAPPPKPTPFDKAIADLDRTIEFHQQRFAATRSWLSQEEIALDYLSRASLTGDARDYAAADLAISEGFQNAIPGSGPFLARARVSFALHRFDRVEADLAAAESALLVAGEVIQTAAEMRADLHYHFGRYREAEAAYEAALARKRTITGLARMAQYRAKTGDFAAAEALLHEALAKAKGETRAWLLLREGELRVSRGDLRAALSSFDEADRAFEGWPLVALSRSKVLLALGDTAGAAAILEPLAARTDNPEHHHALAAVYEARGEFARAAELHEKTKKIFADQIALYPEAFAAHALEHLLGHGSDPRAVEIAEANHRARPNADSLVLLAQAYASERRIADAKSAIESALATPISTAELHATAHYVFALAGDGRARSEKDRAIAINPNACDDLSWMASL